MPPQATPWAARIDWINEFITVIAIFCTVAITAVMIYFAVKYRRKSENDYTPAITHNTVLETVWTVIPTIVVIYVFYFGYVIYKEMRTPPANALEINVQGKMWGWTYEHSSGKVDTGELVVPLNRPVRLIMRSDDVLHSYFIPAMRVKEDVLPSAYSYLWFTPTSLGNFPVFCAEYCGDGHSKMLGTVKVVTEQAYQDYLVGREVGDGPQIPPAQLGEQIFKGKGTCVACHSIDGSRLVGPSLKGAFGRQAEFADGSSIQTDENYLRESIKNPNGKVVKGFAVPSQMPPFTALSEKEIDALVAFIKTLS